MKYGLRNETLRKIINIFSREEKVKKVILYGSRAKGNYRRGSDIDITLIGDNLKLEDLNRLSIKLDDLLLPYSFDISIFKNLQNKDLIDHIERVGIKIYDKDN